MPADPLKLIALDADDLAVISAHVQDARVLAADIVWRQDEKRLVVGMKAGQIIMLIVVQTIGMMIALLAVGAIYGPATAPEL